MARRDCRLRGWSATNLRVALAAAALAAATSVSFPVSTNDRQAQALVDRGVFLYYAFDGGDAAGAFTSAAARDPHLAMAGWGEALAVGPDLNTPMTQARFDRGKAAIGRAVALEGAATPRERAYIDAMSLRYKGTWANWDGNQAQYRQAAVALARSTNDDVAKNLAVEALREDSAIVWNGTVPATDQSRTMLELLGEVLSHDPTDPMANHLCIHAYDNAPDRSPALPCAQRLDAASFSPEAEHLAHMPAHYWIETGDYAKAVASSQRAYDLLVQLNSLEHRSMSEETYAGHDLAVGYSAAMMLGNYASARVWSDRLGSTYEWRYDALTALRFGRYADVLTIGGVELFGPQVRGLALLRLNRVAEARTIAADLLRAGDPRGDLALIFLARVAEAQGNDSDARARLQEAQERQRADYYAENIPFFPAGEALGGYLLRRGVFAQAAAAFTETLQTYPNDPRALFGLWKALDAQGKSAEAARARSRFDAAWAGADTSLTIGDL